VKTKLTITIDEDLVPLAKRYAKSQGTSLSNVIEQALRDASTSKASHAFSERWRGRFKPSNRTSERYRRLARKYL
jgi:hypothetical protein